MKKEYIMPLILVHEVKPISQLMFTSEVHNQNATSAGLAKGGMLWSNDEDFDHDYDPDEE